MKTIPAARSSITRLPDPKDPADTLKYRMDWAPFLTPLSDTISASTWQVDGLSASTPLIEAGALSTTIWLDGGRDGMVYQVSNQVTTSAGRQVTRSFQLEVQYR